LIGISYKEKDCYEILIDFYKQVLSVDLDILYNIKRPTNTEIKNLVGDESGKFIKVHNPQFGDIILFNIIGLPCHIGAYLDRKTFFHTTVKTGSIIDRFENWQKRVIGFYRHPKLVINE